MIASNNNNNFFIGMPFVKQNFDFAPRTIALLLSLLPVTSAWPAELHSIGARVAESADSTNFNQYDLTASFALPWSWRGEWWRLQTLLDTSIGMLKRYDDEGVIVSLGPALELWPGDSNWRLTAGIVPTLISEDVYRKRDLGGAPPFHQLYRRPLSSIKGLEPWLSAQPHVQCQPQKS